MEYHHVIISYIAHMYQLDIILLNMVSMNITR